MTARKPPVDVATIYLSKWPPSTDTYKTMRGALRTIVRALGWDKGYESYPWHQLRNEVARSIAAQLQVAGLAPRSVNKCLVALRGVLEESWRSGELPDEAYRRIKIKNVHGSSLPTGRALDDAEAESFSDGVDSMSPRDAALMALLFACGLRRVEAARLKREDYDPRTGRLRALGKRDKERSIPVAAEWRPIIERWWRELPARSPMFPSDRRDAGLSRSGITLVVERFCRVTGIKRFTPHDLRRTFGTNLIKNGDISIAQVLMGHEKMDTTVIYDHRNEDAEATAVEKAIRRAPPKEK